jgi:DNA (cytosine-5)-methyltransferase 1
MLKTIKFIDLFCGIGGFRVAAENLFNKYDIPHECVFSSDIDENAKKTYQANFNDYPHDDIQKIKSKDIPDHDILFAGFPCQPFSIIGNKKGFEDTRGTLFFEIARILKEKKPKAFILENVKQLVTHHDGYTFKKILETLTEVGYYHQYYILNALNYGLPQKRERVLILGFNKEIEFPKPINNFKQKNLSDILETDVEESYYVSDYILDKRKAKHQTKHFPSIWHENKAGNISSYPYSCALRAGASYNYLLVNGERRLTSREMLRLQGFPDTYKIVVPYTQVRKQAGNAVPVNLIQSVLEPFIPYIINDSQSSKKDIKFKIMENNKHGKEVASVTYS